MHLTLATIEELDRALAFLQAERRRHVQIVWRVGPFSEQAILTAPRVRSSVARFVHCGSHKQEFPLMQVLTDTQQVGISVSFLDKRGNAASVENIQFSVSDSALLSVEADPADASKAVVKAVGPLGSGQVSVQADSLVGEGEAVLIGTLDVQVVAGQAVTAVVSTGTPEEQPEV